MTVNARSTSAMGTDRPVIRLLAREDCDLCDAVEAELAAYGQSCDIAFDVEWVDVDSSPELVSQFGDKVPVLLLNAEELCHYFFDPERVEAALQRWRTRQAGGAADG